MDNKVEQQEPNTKRDKNLLKEYEICFNNAKNLESNIWKTGSIIGIASLASLIYLVKDNSLNQHITIAAGILIILTIWMWWGMAHRWWDIQHITFLRMRHIEKELGLWQYRYVQFYATGYGKDKDKSEIEKIEEAAPEFTESYKKYIKEDLKEYHESDKNIKKRGVQSKLKFFPLLLSVAWVLYIFYVVGTGGLCSKTCEVSEDKELNHKVIIETYNQFKRAGKLLPGDITYKVKIYNIITNMEIINNSYNKEDIDIKVMLEYVNNYLDSEFKSDISKMSEDEKNKYYRQSGEYYSKADEAIDKCISKYALFDKVGLEE